MSVSGSFFQCSMAACAVFRCSAGVPKNKVMNTPPLLTRLKTSQKKTDTFNCVQAHHTRTSAMTHRQMEPAVRSK